MKKRINLWLLATLFLANVSLADAQQTGKVPRIGFLDSSTASGIAVLLEAFRQELSKLGWIEGKNITIEYRFAERKPERLPELAADLVRLKVDLIVVSGKGPALAAKRATTTIPIVMTSAGDPVAAGLVASLARPGGNVTGISSLVVRAKYQKARDTQGRGPQARPSWASAAGREAAYIRPPTERAQVCGSGTKAEIGGDRDSSDAKGLESAFQTAKQKQVGAIMTTAVAAFSPKESGSSSLPANTGCRLFTPRRSLSMRAVSCPTGRTSMTSIGARLFTWTRS